ncbi:unnamed protein product, partial [Discosporangium mesarthrocarpum]
QFLWWFSRHVYERCPLLVDSNEVGLSTESLLPIFGAYRVLTHPRGMVPRCISIMGLALSLFLLSVRVEGTERRKIVLAQGVDTVTAEDLLSGGPCFGTGCRREVLGALASIPYGVPLEGCLITSNAASDASTATMEVVHNCQDRNGNPSQ